MDYLNDGHIQQILKNQAEEHQDLARSLVVCLIMLLVTGTTMHVSVLIYVVETKRNLYTKVVHISSI